MINLDQVRTLEWKVKQAVQLIVHLRRENDTLRGRLSDTEVRLQELESLLEAFKATQSEMETGIRSALEELDHLDGVPTPAEAGPVDPLSYPPASEVKPGSVPAITVTVEALPVAPQVVIEEPEAVEAGVTVQEEQALSFEEEFAALAAAEAAALADDSPVSEEPVPESVELEAEPAASEVEAEEERVLEAPPAPEPEERGPEQPGLGIF